MIETPTAGYLKPQGLRVFRDESNNLCVTTAAGRTYKKVAVRLAFPYSDPEHFIILAFEDEEIGILREPAELDDESHRLLHDVVSKRYHVPRILQILDVRDAHNATRWVVETDMGPRSFLVRDRHNFHRIKSGDLIIVDVDGCRFRLDRDQGLDKLSRKLLGLHG